MEGNPRDAVPRGETGFPHPVKRGGSMASTESRHDLKGDEQHLKPDGYLHLYVHIKIWHMNKFYLQNHPLLYISIVATVS